MKRHRYELRLMRKIKTFLRLVLNLFSFRAIASLSTVGLMVILLSFAVNPKVVNSQNVGAIVESNPSSPASARMRSLGIGLEEFDYPYPVSFIDLVVEGQPLRMAYMDVPASSNSNGRTIVLLHGRNFSGFYWQPTIQALSNAGYRVIVPDQIGFGKSSKPDLSYDLDLLARNTLELLDRLKIQQVDIVGHSMGGMLAVRMARLYQQRIQRLVLETPVGLEDYRLKVPPQTIERLQQDEALTDPKAIERFLRNFVATWVPERDAIFVQLRARLAMSAEYPRWTRAMARTWMTIYREPIRYELSVLTQPTLLVIGLEDRIALGRNYVSPEIRQTMGNFPALGRFAEKTIPRATLVELAGIGHTPHHEAPDRFNQPLLKFLAR